MTMVPKQSQGKNSMAEMIEEDPNISYIQLITKLKAALLRRHLSTFTYLSSRSPIFFMLSIQGRPIALMPKTRMLSRVLEEFSSFAFLNALVIALLRWQKHLPPEFTVLERKSYALSIQQSFYSRCLGKFDGLAFITKIFIVNLIFKCF